LLIVQWRFENQRQVFKSAIVHDATETVWSNSASANACVMVHMWTNIIWTLQKQQTHSLYLLISRTPGGFVRCWPPSNTRFTVLMWVIPPNGISISSPVFAQLTHVVTPRGWECIHPMLSPSPACMKLRPNGAIQIYLLLLLSLSNIWFLRLTRPHTSSWVVMRRDSCVDFGTT